MGATARKLGEQRRPRRCLPPTGRRDRRVPLADRAAARGRRGPDGRDEASRITRTWTRAFARLFTDPAEPDGVREPEAWAAIIEGARDRFVGAQARELADALDGIEAAKQLGRLAKRVSDLVRGVDESQQPAVVAVRPLESRCGLALYRPIDLDKLAESNYLRAAVQPRAALDGAADRRRSHQAPRAHALAAAWSRS